MRLKNIIALPFAFVADIVSFGNIGGDRSFTGQIIDKDNRQDANDAVVEIIKAIAESRRGE